MLNMELKQWVKAARLHKQLTQAQLGALVGRTKANVGHWELGKHEPSWDMIQSISAATGYPMPTEGALSNLEAGPDIKGTYPLISCVQAGMWTELQDNFQPGDAEEWLPSTKSLGAHGYMLRVRGDSMTCPGAKYSFPAGVVLHVRADAVPVPGQFVVVRREGSTEATFKRYVMIDGEQYLEAINPDWPKDMRFLKLQPGDTWCGVVVDATLGELP